ncbi:MAG: hypothetical protein V2J12_06460 [Gammaproteobacteria bacterium]|jgi:hypothetical protein|nr:hypothetical protein [Gammaproteobacteria bacterium]
MGKYHHSRTRATAALMRPISAALAALLAFNLMATGAAQADTRDQAKRIHDRLAGVPPSETVLDTMVGLIESGNPNGPMLAAMEAMENPSFYNVTLKNLATPWTNRDQSVFEPLNDYTATYIGMIRDDVGLDQLLSANLVYHANGASVGGQTAPPYSPSNNAHYEWLEDNGVNLMTELQAATQTAMSGLPAEATAGVMTTRAAAQAFFVAGTNRAQLRFTLLNHLCQDMEQFKDITRPADRVRQDVSRSPGGDSRIFLNNCVGCHSGMDPLAGAFAYYNYDQDAGRIVYTAGAVQDKYRANEETFSPGYVTTDDSWINYWRTGPNELNGWSGGLPGFGNGAKSMGQELASSQAFASCQVKRAFKVACLREPVDSFDRQKVADLTAAFTVDYQMKPVFAEAAAYCMGD